DAMMIYLVQDPARFDVIVTDNLFGDIVTDLAAAVGGGIGLAASGNVNPTGAFPSMFEPVHGSAPDIAGRNLADPTATVLSVALLLDHLGHVEPAAAVRAAVENDLSARAGSEELASRGTTQIGDALVAAIAARCAPAPVTLTPHPIQGDPVSALDFTQTSTTRRIGDDERVRILAAPGFGRHYTDFMAHARWTVEDGWGGAEI